jgi:hypothetical protein
MNITCSLLPSANLERILFYLSIGLLVALGDLFRVVGVKQRSHFTLKLADPSPVSRSVYQVAAAGGQGSSEAAYRNLSLKLPFPRAVAGSHLSKQVEFTPA